MLRVGWVKSLCVVLTLAAASAAPCGAGDEALAAFLLKSGREALDKGDYDDAYSKLKRAFDESLNDFEVQYWLGLCCEKRDDLSMAVGYYRLFLRNVDNAAKAGVLPPSHTPLAKKARARVEVLAVATTERSRLDEALAAKLVALGRKHKTAQPEVAKRAARWAWRLVGDTPLVAGLLADLGEDPRPREMKDVVDPEELLMGQEEKSKPFTDVPEVTNGRSLLYGRVFGMFPSWTYGKGIVTVDKVDSGELAWPAVEQTIGSRFVVEMEMRVLADGGPKWGIGPAFGTKDAFLCVFVGNNQVVFVKGTSGQDLKDLTGKGLQPFDAKSWKRLTVKVDGAAFTAWLDGEKVIEHKAPEPVASTAGIGLWYQRGKYEVRTLRVGRLP